MECNQFGLQLERISFILMIGCNLRCKNCCVQAPYYQHKYYPDLDFLLREIDRLFELADTINFFSIEGGEPLLRKDFAQVLTYLVQYKDRIGVEAPIITNGTLIPNADVLAAAKLLGDKVRFIIDNYGENSPNVNKLTEVLRQEGIRYDVRNYDDDPYCGGWVDLYGNYEEKHTAEDAEALYGKCAWAQKLKGVLEIIGGVIYFCPPSRIYRERELITDESIDILAPGVHLEQIREQIRAIFDKKSLNACRFCNGIHDDSIRYPPAVQLTDEEEIAAYHSIFRYREKLEDIV